MKSRDTNNETGAALIAVLFISLLLVTACAFLLNAVGNNSRNSSDVLAETKAYYAAESGLQATINVFRNNTDANFVDNPYSYAVGDPDLDTKLTNYTTINGIRQVPVGTNSGYSLNITDPDNSGVSTSFSTDGQFLQPDGYSYAATRVFGSGLDTTTISYVGAAATAVHPMNVGTDFGHFEIVSTGAGATMTDVRFRVNYRMTSPRAATKSMNGTITGATRAVEFDATNLDADAPVDYVFSLMGVNNLSLCPTSDCTSTDYFAITLPVPTTAAQPSSTIWGKMLPIEPYRLKLLVTGYARPGNAKKQLEAVIQRNFFNGLGSSSAISMLGPNAYFNVGTSTQMNINGGSNTSITVTDPAGLNNVNTELLGPPNRTANVTPPPQIAGPDLPYWQQSPEAMHDFVLQLKQAAENSGRYFPNGSQPGNFGNFAAGTGITFCDGSCSMSGNSEGGGILVVTGTFSTSGNPRFNGLVLAIGQYVDDANPGGVVRSGGGNEIFTGNIVIAPYDPEDLLAGWGQPRYDQGGGPGDTVNSDVAVDQAFDGTTAITDFVLGIAEK